MTNGMVSFDDLGEVRTDAILVRPDGKQLHVPMRSLSEQEVFTLRAAIQWPMQPNEIRRWDGADKPPRPGPVTSGAAYEKWRKEMETTNRRFSKALLLKSLLIDVPGADDAEKQTALETKLGAWAGTQLTEHLNRMLGITETEVEAKAATFHGSADSDTADTEGAGMDDAEVAETVPHG